MDSHRMGSKIILIGAILPPRNPPVPTRPAEKDLYEL